jgi:hypothetical protein
LRACAGNDYVLIAGRLATADQKQEYEGGLHLQALDGFHRTRAASMSAKRCALRSSSAFFGDTRHKSKCVAQNADGLPMAFSTTGASQKR